MTRGLGIGLVLGAVVFVCAAGQTSAAPAPCSVTLNGGDTSLEAQVGSSSSDAVQFSGNYTVTKPDPTRAVVTLQASVDLGWTATVSPSTITITNQRAGPFTLTIIAPAGARPDQPGIARVEASMIAGGIQCQGSSIEGITVTPLPYLDGLSGTLTPPNVTVKNGASTIHLALGAKANVPVTLTLDYEGPEGVSFTGPATVPLGLNEEGVMNATATVQIRAPELAPGRYQLSVRVRGTTAEGASQEGTLLAPLIVPEPPDLATTAMPFIPLVILGAVAAGVLVWWRRR